MRTGFIQTSDNEYINLQAIAYLQFRDSERIQVHLASGKTLILGKESQAYQQLLHEFDRDL